MRQFCSEKIITMTFENKSIVIAGGTSGIGLATAKQFQQLGAVVTVTGRDAGRLRVAEEAGLRAANVDGRDRVALDTFFAGHGPVDHLVVALGGSKGMGEFSTLSLGELREGFAAKFWPQLETLQSALPYLRAGGSVNLVTAISAIAKLKGVSGLAAMNGALEVMVPILAQELKGIRVNAVSPGLIDTPWWDWLPKEGKGEAFKQFTGNIPAERAGQPEEVADVIVFLAGNGYMTGKVIGCDGGMS